LENGYELHKIPQIKQVNIILYKFRHLSRDYDSLMRNKKPTKLGVLKMCAFSFLYIFITLRLILLITVKNDYLGDDMFIFGKQKPLAYIALTALYGTSLFMRLLLAYGDLNGHLRIIILFLHDIATGFESFDKIGLSPKMFNKLKKEIQVVYQFFNCVLFLSFPLYTILTALGNFFIITSECTLELKISSIFWSALMCWLTRYCVSTVCMIPLFGFAFVRLVTYKFIHIDKKFEIAKKQSFGYRQILIIVNDCIKLIDDLEKCNFIISKMVGAILIIAPLLYLMMYMVLFPTSENVLFWLVLIILFESSSIVVFIIYTLSSVHSKVCFFVKKINELMNYFFREDWLWETFIR
jgi:hypothetical protein